MPGTVELYLVIIFCLVSFVIGALVAIVVLVRASMKLERKAKSQWKLEPIKHDD
jgi:uncharacterized integral membrane protein